MTKSNSHFTDLMITKDPLGNADFIFGVDMDRMVIDNSAYSALIADMTDIAKRQIAANSEVLSFNINRRQVKKELSLNSLGSPMMPEVFSDETISHPVLGSMSEMNEVPLFVTERDARPTLVTERDARPTLVAGQFSGIKYLTASDTDLSEQTAGTYQYELSISLVDGFIPTINKLLKRLYRANNDVDNYLALLNIPDNYDSKMRRARISIRTERTDEMSKAYVDALSYFQNLKNINTEYKRASTLIASLGATKESIGTFQKHLNTVISKVEGLISKTEAGVSPSSVANNPSNSSLPNTPTVDIKQSFNNTISVECRDDKYVDYFKGKGKIGGGLNVYSSTEVKNSTPKTTYLKAPMTSLEMLEARGVSLNVTPSSEDGKCEVENKQTMKTEKFIGASAVSTGGLLKDDLSPIDLSTVSVGSLVSANDINMAVSSMTPKLSSVSSFQAPADNITKVMPKKITTGENIIGLPSESDWIVSTGGTDTLSPVDVLSMTSKSSLSPVDVLSMTSEGITTGGRTGMVFDYQDSLTDKNTLVFDYQDSLAVALSRTMVLVATQDSDMEMCATGGATPMLKSLQWVPIDDIAPPKGATMLCKQENGSLEVANQFHLMEMK